MFSQFKRRIHRALESFSSISIGKSKSFYDEITERIEAISKAKPEAKSETNPCEYESLYKSKSQTVANEKPKDFVKRKKCCVLLGYSGANYFGMQRNATMQTIEDKLLETMLKHEWITEESFKEPKLMKFKSASRTDKGVSASRQCVSMKLPLDIDIGAINKDLPTDIKIFGVKRVTQGFDAKEKCNARTYSYTLPTISFADHCQDVSMETFRLPREKLDQSNELFEMFLGTRNFHNFTKGKEHFDPSAMRHIYSFACDLPFLDKTTNIEFAVIKVKGQSFMMHQIWKMIGLTLAVIRGLTNSETIASSFTTKFIDIPRAPGLGLVLDQPHYDKYNKKYATDGSHEKLDWIDEQNDVQRFFEEQIFSTIVKTEVTEKSMASWLETLTRHTYELHTEAKNPRDRTTENIESENETMQVSESSPDMFISHQ